MRPERRQRLLWVAVVVLPLVMAGAVVLALRPRTGAPSAATIASFLAKPVREDRAAPPFSLPSLSAGTNLTLASFRGRVVVLNLWSSTCDPCRREAPHLEALWTGERARGVVVVGVDDEDRRPSALAFRARFGLTYPMAFDPTGSVASSYTVVGLPTTFLIDRAGRIRYRLLGQVTGSVLRPLIDRLLTAR